MLIIFDIDGTLANRDARRHLKSQGSSVYLGASLADLPNPAVVEALNMLLAQGHAVEIWTGRNEWSRSITVQWLAQQGIDGTLLTRMRPNSDDADAFDATPDDRLKERWLHGLRALPALAFDDRYEICGMFTRHGVRAVLVCEGRILDNAVLYCQRNQLMRLCEMQNSEIKGDA